MKKVESQGKVSEKSGNYDMDHEWQPCVAITHSGRPQTTRYHHSTLMVFGLHLLPSQHSDAPQPTLVAIITHLWSLDPSRKPSAASSAIALTASLVILT